MTMDMSNAVNANRTGQNTGKSTGNGLAVKDLEYCTSTLNDGSKSFLMASHFLPRQVRFAATALYGFCREADDIIDKNAAQAQSLAMALETVRHRIDGIYSEAVLDNATDRALRAVVNHYHLPKPLLDALLQGFEWDTSGRTYRSLEEVEDYAARVAGTVGAMMAVLMGVRDADVLARACDLGVAMQLTNICRDVGEDAAEGRCYLPLDLLQQQSVNPDRLLLEENAPGVKAVIAQLLDRAEDLYERSEWGVRELPENCQRGIRMARQIYAAIGHEVQRLNCDSITQRAVVPTRRKLALLTRHWINFSPSTRTRLHEPCVSSTRFLVEAVMNNLAVEQVDIYHGLLETRNSTKDELNTFLRYIERSEQLKRFDLQADTGKVPMGFTGVVRS